MFENLIEGHRHVSAWIANRSALSELIATKKDYFGRLGILPHENPEVVLMSVERSQDEKNAGAGLALSLDTRRMLSSSLSSLGNTNRRG